jgi:hypothetical protein
MRLIDVDYLLKELEDWQADLDDAISGRQLGVTDAMVIAYQIPTVDIDHIYGYPIKDLIIFADICRKQNISNEDLKDFSRNTALIYEHIQKDFFDNLQKNISYYWTEKEEE